MVKYDRFIIDIFDEYIPYLYDNTLDTADLELNINYRSKAQSVYDDIKLFQLKANNYNKKSISSHHIFEQIRNLEKNAKLYNTWGALQIFYFNNNKHFNNNIIDLHGLYQKEASGLLYVYFSKINCQPKNLTIITGRGNGIINNITISVLNDFKFKFKVDESKIIIKN